MTDWPRIEELAASDRSPNAVALLELRARVKALEAGATCPHVVTADHFQGEAKMVGSVARHA